MKAIISTWDEEGYLCKDIHVEIPIKKASPDQSYWKGFDFAIEMVLNIFDNLQEDEDALKDLIIENAYLCRAVGAGVNE